MRFSSVFQLPVVPPQSTTGQVPGTPIESQPPAPTAAPQALPDELDERVRLIGEWQLGEAD
jgi:hypothetical protein